MIARVSCALVAVAAAWGAIEVGGRTMLPAAPVIVKWERDHPDAFVLSDYQATIFADKRAEKRQQDVLWLLVGLAAGAAVTTFAPRRVVASLGGHVGRRTLRQRLCPAFSHALISARRAHHGARDGSTA